MREAQAGNDATSNADEADDSVELTEDDKAALIEAEDEAGPVSYTATDFDVEGLVRRLDRGDIVIPRFGQEPSEELETARFQRGFVWRRPQMDRFIESLLLEYPIPGIFLVQQVDKRYLVLDGQQRLATLLDFYRGVHGTREFSLANVSEKFKGLTYRTLSEEQRRTIGNTFIQATIVKTDGTPDSLDAVYQVFERLNAGGTQLTPHEIRVALYAGPFVEFLVQLNDDESWRSLYGAKSPRLRDQELVLRIVALYSSASTYKRPLKTYLNDFVAIHRDLKRLPAAVIRERFASASNLMFRGPGRTALRYRSNQVNAALTEALYVGLMRRLDGGDDIDLAALSAAIEVLVSDPKFVATVTRATADDETVRIRLATATRELAKI